MWFGGDISMCLCPRILVFVSITRCVNDQFFVGYMGLLGVLKGISLENTGVFPHVFGSR